MWHKKVNALTDSPAIHLRQGWAGLLPPGGGTWLTNHSRRRIRTTVIDTFYWNISMGSQLGWQEQEPTPTRGGPWPLAGLGAGGRPPGCASSSRLPQDTRALAFTWGQPGSGAAASKLRHTRFWNEPRCTWDGLVKHTALITFAFSLKTSAANTDPVELASL